MIRKVIIAAQRYWRETLAAIVPFLLVLPLLTLSANWISISMGWFSAGVMKWLVQALGSGFIRLFFDLPNFAVSIVVGLAFGIVNAQRALRLAWVFGIGMFVAQAVPAFLSNRSEWYFCLLNLAHVVLPVTTAAVWLRLVQVKQPGLCQECSYDLTGNESGVCPECGTEVESP